MIFIGDVHGLFLEYNELLKKLKKSNTIQLGDMGLGFGRDQIYTASKRNKFIRGNHDNKRVCDKQPTYLGDYGYLKKEGIFYVSGAWSIDRAYRTEGKDWWPDEQLDSATMAKAVKLYEKTKPRIVASHDCPQDILPYVTGRQNNFRNNTSSFLNHLLSIHKPIWWVFAHHHQHFDFEVDGVHWAVVGEMQTFEIKPVPK